MAKDYYKTLGVGKNATKEEIRRAYKELAKKYHPDKNNSPEAAEKFKEINEAASVLADDSKRQQYDQFGTADGFKGFSGFDFGGSGFGGGFEFNFDDIFDMFMGGQNPFSRRRKRSDSERGADLRYDVDIALKEAAFGVEKEILVSKMDECDKCSGSGAEHKSGIGDCPECNGSGYVTKRARTPFGYFQTSGSCRNCGGTGKIIKDPCQMCDGTGRVKKTKKIKINIPAGVETGNQIRVSGQGEAGFRNGSPGDLYVFINVLEDKVFERDGDDIYINIPISFSMAALGDEIDVPTLDGKKAKLKIPSGTQPGTVFRLKGKGIENLHSYRKGDQLVRVNVDVPKKLNKKQKDLIKELDKSLGTKSFLDKVFG
ncbi:molecular chaperone DnaJ [Candidatus Woesearchaeota archaeon]|nr:molecular chaperone DnaJ [Candidatus Woesearchaeota archaeon]